MRATDPRSGEPSSLAVRALRFRPLLVVLMILLGALAGTAYALANPASYTSTARVLINPTVGNPFAPSASATRTDELTSMETEAQLVRSDAVLADAAAEVDGAPAPDDLATRLRVVVPVNTQTLEISYSAPEREDAQAVTQAVAESYLDQRQQRFEEVTQAQLSEVEARTAEVVEELRTATALAQEGDAAQRSFQSQLADALNSELVNLRAQQNTLENSSADVGTLLDPATLPGAAAALTLLVYPVGGALLGLLLGVLLAMAVESARGLVRSRHDVESRGLPVLTVVPRAAQRASGSSKAATRAFDEAVRRIRASVIDEGARRPVVAVAGGGVSGAAGVLADAVAASLARAGHPVVLVDASGSGEQRGGAQAGVGWTDLLAGAHREPTLVPCTQARLFRLPAGSGTGAWEDHVVPDRLTGALSVLARDMAFVVLQVPSLRSPEAEAIARVADLTLVPVLVGRTKAAEVEALGQQVRELAVAAAAVLVATRGPAAAVAVACDGSRGERQPAPGEGEVVQSGRRVQTEPAAQKRP